MSPKRKWTALAILGAACGAGAFLFPISPAIPSPAVSPWRIFESLLAIGLLICAGVVRSGNYKRWMFVAGATALLTAASLVCYSGASQACVLECDSRCGARCTSGQMVIGFELQDYVDNEHGATNNDILFDAGCSPERAWKAASIEKCRMLLILPGLTSIPLAALLGGALIQAMGARRPWFVPAPRAVTKAAAPPHAFDAFISYRHTEPDRTFALDLLGRLEAAGFRVAFDERDFRPNESVIGEMERCIVDSRFTLCVVSSHYIASGFCSEEAEVCKTLDMEQRRRRLIPVFLERVALPGWFGGLVGVDFVDSDPAFDPYEKITSLLRG